MVYFSITVMIVAIIIWGIFQGSSGVLYKIFKWITDTFAGRESSSAGRSGIWKAAFMASVKHPLGLGYGHAGALASSNLTTSQVFSSENSYLTITLDVGWLGTFLYVFFIASLVQIFRRYSKLFIDKSDFYGNRLCVCGFTILIYLSIVMFFSNHIQDMETICFAYLFVGIALHIYMCIT